MAGFDDYDTGGFHDEMFLPDGVPRPEAALLAQLISSLPDDNASLLLPAPNGADRV